MSKAVQTNIIDTIEDVMGLIDLSLLAIKSINVDFGNAQHGLNQTLMLATQNLAIVISDLNGGTK